MRGIAPAAMILLAACGSDTEDRNEQSGNSSAAVDPGATEPIPPSDGGDDNSSDDDNSDDDSSDDGVGKGADPPRKGDDAFFDWTGRFAASKSLCSGGAWNFSRERIGTAGETSCIVDETRDTSRAATLKLSCTAEGMDSKETWTLTRREDGMSVRRDTGRETINVDLIRCG